MGKELLLILPAFNEEAVIGRFLDSLAESGVFEKADVLVIDDGSADNTAAIAREKGAKVVSHVFNMGYGCALQTGYKFAVRGGYDYLIQMDSDGQHDICNIDNLYAALKSPENTPDIVIGSRFFESSVTFTVSRQKKVAIWIFRRLIRMSTKKKILDPTSGLQGISRRAFLFCSQYDNFVPDYPDANMIIQLLLSDFTITEIPAVMHARESGKSMHSGLKPILYMLKMLLNIAIVILREKYFKKKRVTKADLPGAGGKL